MQHLSYRGLLLGAADLNQAVAAAASGTPPQPRRPEGEPVDGPTWIVGLIDAAATTPFEEPVTRALDMVLRTGDSRRLDALAQVAEQRPVFDASALLATLERPHIWRNRDTPPRLARAISAAVVSGRSPLAPQLRAWASERRLRGALVPAFLSGDPDWFADNLVAVLGDDPETAAARLHEALQALPEAARRLRGVAISRRLDQLPVVLRAALQQALQDVGAVDPPGADATGGISLHQLPWRGQDGGWFLIPKNVELLYGPFVLRRGGVELAVDPDAAAPFRIPDARARQLQASQLDAMWGVLRDAARAALRARPTTTKAADAIPETVGDLFNTRTELLFRERPQVGPEPVRAPRDLDEALDRPEVRAFVGSLAERLRAAAAEANAALKALADDDDA